MWGIMRADGFLLDGKKAKRLLIAGKREILLKILPGVYGNFRIQMIR